MCDAKAVGNRPSLMLGCDHLYLGTSLRFYMFSMYLPIILDCIYIVVLSYSLWVYDCSYD